MPARQRTIAAPSRAIEGPGLHSGAPSALVMLPGRAGGGFVIRRADLPGAPEIPARVGNVVSCDRATVLGAGQARAGTVEHALAACALAGLDCAILDLKGEEVPAADGSALPFLEAIEEAGVKELEAPREPLVLRGPIKAKSGNAMVRAEPADKTVFAFEFGSAGALKGRRGSFSLSSDDVKALARARTFCFESDIERILASGLGRGGTTENCLVLADDGAPLNGARDPEEPVNHKILDLIGDFALAGAPVRAVVTGRDSGHAQNIELVRLLTTDIKNKEVTETHA